MNHPIFDECAYMHLCATGQVDNLPTFLEVEKRYRITGAECSSYRRALDTAASSAQANEGGGATTSSSNTDWRYRISRWMLKVSSIYSRLCKILTLVLCSHLIEAKSDDCRFSL